MANFCFAVMDNEHISAVQSIEQLAHSHPWKPSMIAELNGRGAFNYVLMVAGQVVGYFYAQNIVGEVSLLNIAVAPEHQGKGYGRVLLSEFLKQCESRNAESAWLEVRASNHAAISLYLAQGFNEVDRRRDYYPAAQGREDAVIMSHYFLFSGEF